MEKEREPLVYEWEETGSLEIFFENDMNATVRFFPSEKVIQEQIAKFRKNPVSNDKESEQQHLQEK